MKVKFTVVLDVEDEAFGVIQACKVEKEMRKVLMNCKMKHICKDSFIQPMRGI